MDEMSLDGLIELETELEQNVLQYQRKLDALQDQLRALKELILRKRAEEEQRACTQPNDEEETLDSVILALSNVGGGKGEGVSLPPSPTTPKSDNLNCLISSSFNNIDLDDVKDVEGAALLKEMGSVSLVVQLRAMDLVAEKVLYAPRAYRGALLEMPVLELVVDLLQKSSSYEMRRHATRFLFGSSQDPSTAEALCKIAIGPLISQLEGSDVDTTRNALYALTNIAAVNDSTGIADIVKDDRLYIFGALSLSNDAEVRDNAGPLTDALVEAKSKMDALDTKKATEEESKNKAIAARLAVYVKPALPTENVSLLTISDLVARLKANVDLNTRIISALELGGRVNASGDIAFTIYEMGGLQPIVEMLGLPDISMQYHALRVLLSILSSSAYQNKQFDMPNGTLKLVSGLFQSPLIDMHSMAMHVLMNLSVVTVNQKAMLPLIPLLISLLSSSDTKTRRNTAATLCNLTMLPEGCESIRCCGGITALVSLLKTITIRAVQLIGARGVSNFSWSDSFHADLVAANAVSWIVSMLCVPHGDVKLQAMWALSNLSSSDVGREAILSEGGVPLICSSLASPFPKLADIAAFSLSNISLSEKGTLAIQGCGGVRSIVALLDCPTVATRELALRSLVNASCNEMTRDDFVRCEGFIIILNAIDSVSNESSAARQFALMALANLCISESCREELYCEGGLSMTLALLEEEAIRGFHSDPVRSSEEQAALDSLLRLLMCLAVSEFIRMTILDTDNVRASIVGMEADENAPESTKQQAAQTLKIMDIMFNRLRVKTLSIKKRRRRGIPSAVQDESDGEDSSAASSMKLKPKYAAGAKGVNCSSFKSVTIKLHLDTEVKLITVATDIYLHELIERVRERYRIHIVETVTLKYRDSSRDTVPLDSDEALEYAFSQYLNFTAGDTNKRMEIIITRHAPRPSAPKPPSQQADASYTPTKKIFNSTNPHDVLMDHVRNFGSLKPVSAAAIAETRRQKALEAEQNRQNNPVCQLLSSIVKGTRLKKTKGASFMNVNGERVYDECSRVDERDHDDENSRIETTSRSLGISPKLREMVRNVGESVNAMLDSIEEQQVDQYRPRMTVMFKSLMSVLAHSKAVASTIEDASDTKTQLTAAMENLTNVLHVLVQSIKDLISGSYREGIFDVIADQCDTVLIATQTLVQSISQCPLVN